MPRGPHFVVYQDADDRWRWNFSASNGQVVCDGGQGYKTKSACIRACERVQTLMETATIKVDD